MKPSINHLSDNSKIRPNQAPVDPMGASGALLPVRFTAYAYGGEALGRLPDGRAVFVPYAIQGEKALVQIVEEHPRFVRARLSELLEPSAERVQPRCEHFGICGGCHYQHMAYAAQAEAKAAILVDQLSRVGGIQPDEVLAPTTAKQAWNYRNHVQFHLAAPDPGAAGSLCRLGFVSARAPQPATKEKQNPQVIPIRNCHLPEEAINSVWPLIEIEPVEGLERVSLRAGSDGEILLTLESDDPAPPEFDLELPISAVHLSPAGKTILAGNEFLRMDVLDRPFRLSAGAFFQVNTAMAGAMVEHVLRGLALDGRETILDLYSGVGLFSAFLAPRAVRLVAVEVSPSACNDFEENLTEFDNVELYEGAVEEILSSIDVRPQVVLLDPPRAGLAAPACQALLNLKPETIVYVSCDPVTLARDGGAFTRAGYTCRQVALFDLFPQTCHIESVSFWRRLV